MTILSSKYALFARRCLMLAGALAMAWILAATAIVVAGLHDSGGKADMIVVPGNTVYPDGRLSERLQARLDVALVLFRQGRAPRIFVSGGMGKEGRDEAAAMAAYLLEKGVPAGAVIQDRLGVDTAATAQNAARYLRANHLGNAIVATQYFHVARTTLALERNGVNVSGSGFARFWELRDVWSLMREVAGYAGYFYRLKLQSRLV